MGLCKGDVAGLDPLRPPEIEVCHNVTVTSLRDQLTPSALELLMDEGARLDLDAAFEELSHIA